MLFFELLTGGDLLYLMKMLALSTDNRGMDDAALVNRILVGDDRAFALLYRRHARYLAKVIVRILGNDSELDDVMQETFIAASRYVNDVKDPQKMRPWLVQIAVRIAQKRVAKQKRMPSVSLETRHLSASSDAHDNWAREVLYAALDTLSSRLRTPWILYRIEGFSLLETADACEVSLATVKRRVTRAEKKLRSKIDAYR